MARLVFLGTPEAAVQPLRTLVRAGHDVALVVTRPDKRRGRGAALVPSPVKAAATELGLPVTDSLDDAVGVGAELGVVVAYGRIIPVAVLDRLPMVNLHFSLLPRWRGAAPVERAILEGDAETGVCLMAVEAGLDTGAIYAEVATAIDEDETADELCAPAWWPGLPAARGAPGRGPGRPAGAPGPGRHPVLRREDPARGARAPLGPAGRPAPPGGAAGTGLDHLPAAPARRVWPPPGSRGRTVRAVPAGRRRGTLDGTDVGPVAAPGCAWSPSTPRGSGPWTPPTGSAASGPRPASAWAT